MAYLTLCDQKDLLREVFGVLDRSGEPVGVLVDRPMVVGDQLSDIGTADGASAMTDLLVRGNEQWGYSRSGGKKPPAASGIPSPIVVRVE